MAIVAAAGPRTIAGSELTVTVDSAGFRITSIVPRATGRELLFVAPWSARPVPTEPATNRTWIEQWPGGWDVLATNAGAACVVDGVVHPFHGHASVASWRLHGSTPGAVTGTWRDRSGVTIERTVSVDGRRVRVTNEVANPTETAVPFSCVEHLILALGAFGDGASIDVAGEAIAFGDSRQPIEGWDAFTPWPAVRRHGTLEDWRRTPPAGTERSGVIRNAAPPIVITSDDDAGNGGLTARLTWSTETLPYVWLWIDNEASAAYPDGRSVRCLGVEPASVPSGEGLAANLTRGRATRLAPGARWRSWTAVEIIATPAG